MKLIKDVDMIIQWVDPTTTTGVKGAASTLEPTLASISAPAATSTFPSHSLVCFMIVPRYLLHMMVEKQQKLVDFLTKNRDLVGHPIQLDQAMGLNYIRDYKGQS